VPCATQPWRLSTLANTHVQIPRFAAALGRPEVVWMKSQVHMRSAWFFREVAQRWPPPPFLPRTLLM
jgi:hypothetical protein